MLMRITRLWAAALVMVLLISGAAAAQLPRVVAAGLKAPARLLALDSGLVLVSEGGNGANTGRISVLTTDGGRSTLIDGLPSGFAPPENQPIGPTGLAVRNRTVYMSIGGGDSVVAGPAPGTELPNPNRSSPVLSAVLALELDRDLLASNLNFFMAPAHHAALASGQTVTLMNAQNEVALLRLVVDIADTIPDPRPTAPANVRVSNPFGLELADSCGLWLVDASRNTLSRVDVCNNTVAIRASFAPYNNPLPVAPPVLDAVPTSVHAFDSDLLVSFLSGAPFPPGVAEVRLVKPQTGESSTYLRGFRMVTDVLPLAGSPDGFLVLEFSADPAAGVPGRILYLDSTQAAPAVLVGGLITPTSLAVSPRTGEILVSELATGRVVAVARPR